MLCGTDGRTKDQMVEDKRRLMIAIHRATVEGDWRYRDSLDRILRDTERELGWIAEQELQVQIEEEGKRAIDWEATDKKGRKLWRFRYLSPYVMAKDKVDQLEGKVNYLEGKINELRNLLQKEDFY